MNCEELHQHLQGFSLVEACDVIRNDKLRIATPFRYPDGSAIDVFLQTLPNLYESYLLSDLGQTSAYLFDMQIKLFTTKRRKQLVSDICDRLGVINNNGQFEISISNNNLAQIPAAIVRLSQTCIRISDLAFTQRFRSVNSFYDEVEEYISSIDLSYEPDVELTGRYNNLIKIDFRIQGPRVNSLVQTLSTGNQAFAHNIANEVFRKWYDLRPNADSQKITLIDTTNNIFRGEDIDRLRAESTVFAFPEQEADFHAAVAA